MFSECWDWNTLLSEVYLPRFFYSCAVVAMILSKMRMMAVYKAFDTLGAQARDYGVFLLR